MSKVTVKNVTGLAPKQGTFTSNTKDGVTTSTANGPAKMCLLMECGFVEVEIQAGEAVTITWDGTDAVVVIS